MLEPKVCQAAMSVKVEDIKANYLYSLWYQNVHIFSYQKILFFHLRHLKEKMQINVNQVFLRSLNKAAKFCEATN